jgi:hypothetical protein
MTRLLLIILLFLSSGPAYAEWVEVVGAGHDQYTLYADPTTVRRKGNMVKMWELSDYKTIQASAGKSYLSYKGQNEYNCTEEQMRILARAEYSGSMGAGETVDSNTDPGKWFPVMPGTVSQALWELACNKR